MIISVTHEVAKDLEYCWDGDSGGYYIQCRYVKYRDRHGKKGTPILRRQRRCTLFNTWLEESPPSSPLKCPECLKACEAALAAQNGGAE